MPVPMITSDLLLEAEVAVREAKAAYDTARTEREQLVSRALRAHWGHTAIAEAMGLTRGRIGQMAMRLNRS